VHGFGEEEGKKENKKNKIDRMERDRAGSFV
jgi:hypothetical protein